MKPMAQRQMPDREAADEVTPASPLPMSTVLWLGEGRICVAVVDTPPRDLHRGACRCDACHAGQLADLGENFLP